jgi:hypothetical protein
LKNDKNGRTVSGFTFVPWPQCGGAWQPAHFPTYGLLGPAQLAWANRQSGSTDLQPSGLRPTASGAGEQALLCGHHARRGVAARCPPATRWPRGKKSVGVSTDVERWTCCARRQGRGLTEEVAQRWGGGENSA